MGGGEQSTYWKSLSFLLVFLIHNHKHTIGLVSFQIIDKILIKIIVCDVNFRTMKILQTMFARLIKAMLYQQFAMFIE
jgi:hypothetical protein